MQKKLHLYFFVFLSLTTPLYSSDIDDISILSTCLIDCQIYNFTTRPPYIVGQSIYFQILTSSLNNLRCSEPTTPKPRAMIVPNSLEQLVNSLLCSRKLVPKWDVRVRGGGHSYEGTSYAANGRSPFVMIDMMNLNNVSVNLKTKTAWVEAGATLGEIYYAISRASNKLGFSGGSCPTVGSGGHISGGGFGFLSRKYGVAADNVVDAILIDPNGKVLNSTTMGEDVFWAIRGGGGGNWGIVYAWKIKLSKVPTTVTVFTVSRVINVIELVHKWQLVAPRLTKKFYLSCFIGANLSQAQTQGISAAFNGLYLGPKTKALDILHEAFPELGIVEKECEEMSWIESIIYFSDLPKGTLVSDLQNRYLQYKTYFKNKSDYAQSLINSTGIEVALHYLKNVPKGFMILDPYGGIMDAISSTSIPFPHRAGNLFSIQYVLNWEKEDNYKRQEFVDWMRKLYDAMVPYVASNPRAAAVNYMDFDLGIMDHEAKINQVEYARSWGEMYFSSNYDRLVKAKSIIDPENIFNNQQSVPPLSSKFSTEGESNNIFS